MSIISITTSAAYLPTFQKSLHVIFDEALPQLLTPDGVIFLNGHITRQDKEAEEIRVIDLGSGDGRVVLEASRRGYCAVGYEINPLLVLISKLWNAFCEIRMSERIRGSASFYVKDIWDISAAEIGEARLIFVYGLGPIMQRLAEKLHKEGHPNLIVVSNVFEIKSTLWQRVYHNQEVNVHIYKRRKVQ